MITNIAQDRPLLFILLMLLCWFLISAVLVVASASIFDIPLTDDLPQIIGPLGSTVVLLSVVNRLGWLSEIGITRFGRWRSWLLVLALGLFFIIAYLYAFFSNISFDIGIFIRSDAAREVLLRNGIVGFVEETLFRGIILFTLVRVWGGSRRGLWIAVIVQAAIFGLFHILQALVGIPLSSVWIVMINSMVSGIWWAALVLAFGSLWPVIFLHAASNTAVLVKGLSSVYIQPATWVYTRATLLEIPLLVYGLWLLTRVQLRTESPEDTPREEVATA
jgi:membrane protease YdiL (CAAX protease family)